MVTFEVGILSIGCVEMVMLVDPVTCWNEYPYSIAGLLQKQGGYIMAGPPRAPPPLAYSPQRGARGPPRCRGGSLEKEGEPGRAEGEAGDGPWEVASRLPGGWWRVPFEVGFGAC